MIQIKNYANDTSSSLEQVRLALFFRCDRKVSFDISSSSMSSSDDDEELTSSLAGFRFLGLPCFSLSCLFSYSEVTIINEILELVTDLTCSFFNFFDPVFKSTFTISSCQNVSTKFDQAVELLQISLILTFFICNCIYGSES